MRDYCLSLFEVGVEGTRHRDLCGQGPRLELMEGVLAHRTEVHGDVLIHLLRGDDGGDVAGLYQINIVWNKTILIQLKLFDIVNLPHCFC